MGQQYNKVIKRRRRQAYLKRKHLAAKQASLAKVPPSPQAPDSPPAKA